MKFFLDLDGFSWGLDQNPRISVPGILPSKVRTVRPETGLEAFGFGSQTRTLQATNSTSFLLLHTGRGYLTLKIKSVKIGLYDDPKTKYLISKRPTANLFINGVKEATTNQLDNCYNCHFNFTYESNLMYKNSTIEIEVWEAEGGLILSRIHTIGTIDDYLTHRLQYGTPHRVQSYIETATFWKDEYEMAPIADVFLAEPLRNMNRIANEHNQRSEMNNNEEPKNIDNSQKMVMIMKAGVTNNI